MPVPCASTKSTSDGDNRAFASAARITRSCARPFGAARPFDAPSWLTAVPRTTASTGWSLRTASDNRSTSNSPTPSDQPVPSAAAANDLHRPSPASPPLRVNSVNMPGPDITVTPPARASEHSPRRRDSTARCTATNEDEQAVSTVRAGPSRPKVYATRPDTTLVMLPVMS
ncbi:Secreted protein [Kibdelosporangium persicum]